MQLKSQKKKLGKPCQEIFELLCQVQNFEKLMPENTVKFETQQPETFLFGLSGMPEIELKIAEKTTPTKIVMKATSDKVPFQLQINLVSISEKTTEIEFNFDGNFNPMMAMMIKGPVQKLIDTWANNCDRL